MFKLFRSKAQPLDEATVEQLRVTPEERERCRNRYEESCRYLEAASKEKLEAALKDVEGIGGDLHDLGITLKADGNNVAVYWNDPKPRLGGRISISLSHAEAFCRLVRHITTVPPRFIEEATAAVGEELAAFGVTIASTPAGFSVTQDGTEGATATVDCAGEAVFLGMALALRRAGQERQAAPQPEPDPSPEPEAGAQIISFAAEQARRQGDAEAF